jgi:hypothetical protein
LAVKDGKIDEIDSLVTVQGDWPFNAECGKLSEVMKTWRENVDTHFFYENVDTHFFYRQKKWVSTLLPFLLLGSHSECIRATDAHDGAKA